MGFRELARAYDKTAREHAALATAFGESVKEHTETRRVVAQIAGQWNGFVKRGFFARLRWLVFGR